MGDKMKAETNARQSTEHSNFSGLWEKHPLGVTIEKKGTSFLLFDVEMNEDHHHKAWDGPPPAL